MYTCMTKFFCKTTITIIKLVHFESHSNPNLTLMINIADGYFLFLRCFKSAKMNSLNN